MLTKKKNKDYKIKSLILKKTKNIVRVDGWSQNILTKLIKNGVKSTDITFYFKNDYKNLLEFSLEDTNIFLEEEIKKINIINFTVSKRIKKILITRINILNDDIIFFKKTFNHIILPQNIKIMKKNLYNTVDNMWYLAGDNSTDFNFYTKRIILASIYSNALILLYNKGLKDAEINIENNLKRISKIPKLKERFSLIKDGLPIFLKGFFN